MPLPATGHLTAGIPATNRLGRGCEGVAKLNDKQLKSLLRKGEAGKHALGGGLYFRVSNEGTGFWQFRYTAPSGKRREMIFDRYPDLPLADAVTEAAKLKAQVRKGVDLLAEKTRPAPGGIRTVNDLAADWLRTDVEKRLKHPRIPRRIYERLLAPSLGELAIDTVGPLDVRGAVEAVTASGRKTVATDALGVLKGLFRHGVKLGLLTVNPAAPFTCRDAGGIEQARDRVLTRDELAAFFQVARKAPSFGRDNLLMTALLLVTCVRKGELLAATWSEFDTQERLWNLPAERTKTSAAITIPLPLVAVHWLEELKVRGIGSEFVFPARRTSKRSGHISPDTLNRATERLFGKGRPGEKLPDQLGAVGVEYFRIHDLRRTARTLLAELGTAAHVAEACLNHRVRGVQSVYDKYTLLPERAEALENLAAIIEPLVSGESEQ